MYRARMGDFNRIYQDQISCKYIEIKTIVPPQPASILLYIYRYIHGQYHEVMLPSISCILQSQCTGPVSL